MAHRSKLLPPLDYLVAFEAAAKLGGFARAASELHISESAISRKVRLLEAHYGVTLFRRHHRSVELTDHGAEFFAAVANAMDDLRDASESLFAKDQEDIVDVAATNSVAALWLMPRLREFHRQNASVRIKLTASDSDAECLGDRVGLSILRGDGDWSGYDAQQLFGETIFPVCSPAYLDSLSGDVTLDSLTRLDLIEVNSNHPEWMDWTRWLRSQGLQDPVVDQAAIFNTYPLAIQAAVDGLGLALGWGHLVDRYLDSGALVRPMGDAALRTRSGYYLLRRKGQTRLPSQDVVAKWLLNESARRKRYEETQPG